MDIGFRWLDEGPSKDFIDLFDQKLFIHDIVLQPIVHQVLRPSGRHFGYARCLMTLQGNTVTLDYECFTKWNEFHDIALGVTKFEYEKNAENPITNVRWKDKNNAEFDKCDFEFKSRNSKRRSLDGLNATFQSFDDDARELSDEELNNRLPQQGTVPQRITVATTVFVRNPYVVEARLRRAKGHCGECGEAAPFNRKTDGQPYLEVHHIQPLSENGTDVFENTIALCPNCHRKHHHGSKT